jgi:hypothetical protein
MVGTDIRTRHPEFGKNGLGLIPHFSFDVMIINVLAGGVKEGSSHREFPESSIHYPQAIPFPPGKAISGDAKSLT